MAEVTSQDFQKLLAEQQRTNELMVQANKDPSLPSSIKQNLGEILNASRLARQSEKFQKTTGITDTDDAVRENVSEQIETNKGLLGLGDLLIFQNSLIEKLVAIQDRVLSLTDVKTIRLGPTASQETEMQKDADARFKSSKQLDEDNLEENKKTNKLLGFLQGLRTPAGLKSVVGKLFGLLGLLALFKFLTGPNALKLAEALDKTVLPALKDLGTFLLSVGGKVATFIGDMAGVLTDPDSTTMEKVGASLALLITGGLVLFSKSILGFLGGLAVKALFKLAGLGIGKTIILPILQIFGRILPIIGSAAAGLIEGFKDFDEAREEGDNVLLALTKGVGGFIAGFVGFLPDLLVKGIGKFVGIFDEELGKKIEAFSFTGIIKDVLGVIGDTVKDLFMGLFSGIRKLLFGKTREDLESELEKDRAMEERLKKELEETNKKGKALQRIKGKLSGAQKRIEKAEGELKKLEELGATTTGGLFGTMSQVDTVSGGMVEYDARGRVKSKSLKKNFTGGFNPAGTLALIGEGVGGRGGELVYMGGDAMVLNQQRTDAMLTAALQKGLSSGGGDGGDVITQIDGRVNNSSSILSVNNNRVTNPNSTLNAIAMST